MADGSLWLEEKRVEAAAAVVECSAEGVLVEIGEAVLDEIFVEVTYLVMGQTTLLHGLTAFLPLIV